MTAELVMSLVAIGLVFIDLFVVGRRNRSPRVGLMLWDPALLLLILARGDRFSIAIWGAVVGAQVFEATAHWRRSA